MGRAIPLDRDLILTEANLAVASARQGGVALDPAETARSIVLRYPNGGVSDEELTAIIADLVEAGEPDPASSVNKRRALIGYVHVGHLSREGAGREEA